MVFACRQNQTVGWPPVRNFVRNNNPVRPAPPPSAPATACPSVQGKVVSSSTNTNSWFVKIYMDGVPFGRKVDLKTNNSYEKLYPALEEMFQQFISGMYLMFCGLYLVAIQTFSQHDKYVGVLTFSMMLGMLLYIV